MSTLDDRAAAIAARVPTMRKAEQDASVEPDAVSAQGRNRWLEDHEGQLSNRLLMAVALVMLDTDPDGFAAALHMIGRQVDIPAELGGAWFFIDTVKPTWDRVEALLAAGGDGP